MPPPLWIACLPEPDAPTPEPAGPWLARYGPAPSPLEDGWVLEVSASQRLFGGRHALLKQLLDEGRPRGWPRHGVASTALAALALARLPPTVHDRSAWGTDAIARLDALPLRCLSASHPHQDVLASLGLRTLGDLRRCPRAGLAQRTRPALLTALDQLYGTVPLVLPAWQPPDAFHQSIDLPAPTTDAGALAFAAQRLLSRLMDWLRQHQRGVLHWQLGWRAADTPLDFRHRQPQQDAALLLRLLQEALARTVLDAPVEQLWLGTVETAPCPPTARELLPGQAAADALPWDALVERLSAWLGAQRVLTVQRQAHWDPANRQRWQPAVAGPDRSASPPAAPALATLAAQWEPPWRLPQPRPLPVGAGGVPVIDGWTVRRLLGPQRIATGWWDAPVEREICVVTTDDGRCWSLDRDRGAESGHTSAWRLSGIYA